MGGRTVYRTLSPKRTPFQIGIDRWPHCKRSLEEDESAIHILCDCEAIAYLRFHHLGQFFMEQSDYYDTPHKQSPTFHSKCRINKGLIRRGSTIDHWKLWCKGWIIMAHPSYISSHFIEVCFQNRFIFLWFTEGSVALHLHTYSYILSVPFTVSLNKSYYLD
jgi:hypothetical protein